MGSRDISEIDSRGGIGGKPGFLSPLYAQSDQAVANAQVALSAEAVRPDMTSLPTSLQALAKDIAPPLLVRAYRRIRGTSLRFDGNFSTWSQARSNSFGYRQFKAFAQGGEPVSWNIVDQSRIVEELVSNVLAEYKSKIVVFATHDRELASMVDHVISIYPLSQVTHSMAASNE
jgi:hypothetical protein